MMLDHFTIKATGHYTMLVSSGIRARRRVGTDCRFAILPWVYGLLPPSILNLKGDEAGRVSVNCQWIDIALYATTRALGRSGKSTASVLPR
jgi:hypothetical protein